MTKEEADRICGVIQALAFADEAEGGSALLPGSDRATGSARSTRTGPYGKLTRPICGPASASTWTATSTVSGPAMPRTANSGRKRGVTVTEFTIKPVGWRFTDSNGAERIKTRWQFNAFVTQEGAKSAALALGRPGSEWFIWRLEDGSYDHTAVPDPAAPGHPAELAERFTIAGYGKHRRAVPSG